MQTCKVHVTFHATTCILFLPTYSFSQPIIFCIYYRFSGSCGQHLVWKISNWRLVFWVNIRLKYSAQILFYGQGKEKKYCQWSTGRLVCISDKMLLSPILFISDYYSTQIKFLIFISLERIHDSMKLGTGLWASFYLSPSGYLPVLFISIQSEVLKH